jgi:hypothetical protein
MLMGKLFTTVGVGNDGPLTTRTPSGRIQIPPPPLFEKIFVNINFLYYLCGIKINYYDKSGIIG